MKDTCFFTVYDRIYKNIAQGCVRSVKRLYPDIDYIEYEIPRIDSEFDLQGFCQYHLDKGQELLKEYKRIISVDADHIMCNECPQLFEEYDFGIVINNVTFFVDHYPTYFNAGLTVCTKPELWDMWKSKYEAYSGQWNPFTEQNTLNDLYYENKDKYVFKVLGDDQSSYGIIDYEGYHEIYMKDNELYVLQKKLCMLHLAGTSWIDHKGGIVWSAFWNETARQKLQELTQ